MAQNMPRDKSGRLDTASFQYTLTKHSDEFRAFDSTKWDKKLGDWIGTAPGAFKESLAQVEDREGLTLRTRRKPGFAPDGVTDDCDCGFGDYMTAMVASTHKFKYGFFEIKANFVPEKVLSSFWLQGSRGEINVVEYSEGTALNSNYHCFDPAGTPEDTVDAPFDMMTALETAGLDLADFASPGMHVYGIDWTKDYVDYFVDGEFIHRVDTTTGAAACLVDDEMNVIISTEITAALGLPNNGGQFDETGSVAYFRHWERTEKSDATDLAPSTHSVSSCDELGWAYNDGRWADEGVCARVGFKKKKATKKAEFGDAEEFCTDRGARLCSAHEVAGRVGYKNAKKSKPKMHKKYIWTSDDGVCGPGKRLAVKHNDGKEKCIKAKKRSAGIMCCADDIAAGQPMIGAAAGASSSSALIEAEDSEEPSSTGAAAAAAGGLVAVICLVGLIAAIVIRNRGAAAASADIEVGPQQRRVSGPLSLPGSRRSLEAGPIDAVADLNTDNGFVLDQAGTGVRVASVRRANPMFRGSVYAPEDAIGEAAVDTVVVA